MNADSTITEAATSDPSTATESTIDPDIATYLLAVRSHLLDIDDEELQELSDELLVHLQEVRAETDEPFGRVLGDPAAFAAELRLAAGFPESVPSGAQSHPLDDARDRLFALADHRWVVAVRDFLPELRSAWWLARAFLVVIVLAAITGPQVNGSVGLGFPIPRVFGSQFLGFFTLIGAMVASVRIGRAEFSGGWRRAAVLGAGGLAAIGALLVFGRANEVRYPEFETLAYADAGPDYTILPANIYAYSIDGEPLDGVLLYNEIGNPVVLPRTGYTEQLGAEFQTILPLDADGREVANLYPRELLVEQSGVDDNGVYVEGGPRRIDPPLIGRFPQLSPSATDTPTTAVPTTAESTTAESTTAVPSTEVPVTAEPAPTSAVPSENTPTTTTEPLRNLDGSLIDPSGADGDG